MRSRTGGQGVRVAEAARSRCAACVTRAVVVVRHRRGSRLGWQWRRQRPGARGRAGRPAPGSGRAVCASETPKTNLSGRSTSTEPCLAPARRSQPGQGAGGVLEVDHARGAEVVRRPRPAAARRQRRALRTSPRPAARSRRPVPSTVTRVHADADHGPADARARRRGEPAGPRRSGPSPAARARPRRRESRGEAPGSSPLRYFGLGFMPMLRDVVAEPRRADGRPHRGIPGLRLGRVLHRDQALVEDREVDHRLGVRSPLASGSCPGSRGRRPA